MYKKTSLVLAATALFGLSVNVFALTIQPFEIHWTEGSLADTISVGSFGYDESLVGGAGPGGGEEGLTILTPEHGLSSFDVIVDDHAFAIEDDEGFPELPEVEFDGIEPIFIDYSAILFDDEMETPGPSLDLFGFVGIADDDQELSAIFFPEGFFTDAEPIVIEEPSLGFVVLTRPVPETGATMILMGISLLALSAFRRGRT